MTGKPTGDVMQRAIQLLKSAEPQSHSWLAQRDALFAEIEPPEDADVRVMDAAMVWMSGNEPAHKMPYSFQRVVAAWNTLRHRLAAPAPAAIDENAIRKDERAKTEREFYQWCRDRATQRRTAEPSSQFALTWASALDAAGAVIIDRSYRRVPS